MNQSVPKSFNMDHIHQPFLRYSDPEDRFFLFFWFFFSNRVISVISIVQRETTLTISDSTGEPVSMESGVVIVVFHSKTKIPVIT